MNWRVFRFAREKLTAIPEITKNRGMIHPEMKVSKSVKPRSGVAFVICHGGGAKGLLL